MVCQYLAFAKLYRCYGMAKSAGGQHTRLGDGGGDARSRCGSTQHVSSVSGFSVSVWYSRRLDVAMSSLAPLPNASSIAASFFTSDTRIGVCARVLLLLDCRCRGVRRAAERERERERQKEREREEGGAQGRRLQGRACP